MNESEIPIMHDPPGPLSVIGVVESESGLMFNWPGRLGEVAVSQTRKFRQWVSAGKTPWGVKWVGFDDVRKVYYVEKVEHGGTKPMDDGNAQARSEW